MEDIKKIQEFFSKPLNENIVVRMYNPTDKTANLYKEDNPGLEFYLTGKEGQDYIRKYKDHISFPFSSHMNDGTPISNYEENKEKLTAYLNQNNIPFKTTSAKPFRGVSRTSGEEFMYTTDTFKVPLSHVDIKDISLNEMDINDPVMMKMRAAKDKLAKMRAANAGDDGNDKFFDNAKKIAFLKKERAQLMRDMEQEAEPEGGPIADEYGSKLNRIDKAIAKLSGRKEMTYDQAIAEELSPKDFPVNFTYGGTTYVFNKIDRKDRAVYYNPRMDGDTAVFRSREEMDSFLDDYTSPRGGTQSSQFEAIAENDSYVRVSEPKFIKDKNNPNFLYVNFKYDTGGGVLTALGKETMAGQIRRLSSAEAMKQATALAKDLEAKYNLEDIDVYDKENGVVQIFAVSDDFMDMDPNMLSESKMPTQDQVDKFFALTQNETHYLNSKPVAGQEKTFNLMPIEPWDEYDLSNWNSLVRKAKQQGKLSEDKFKPHMMYDPKTGKGYKANKKEDHERMDKMGYTHEKPSVKESISQTLAETIKLGEGVIEEELCPKGKAYIKRRKAAGEKSSAYLSGRAVKVCKGQMSGRKKRKSKKK